MFKFFVPLLLATALVGQVQVPSYVPNPFSEDPAVNTQIKFARALTMKESSGVIDPAVGS